jgi:hypothetical protein
MFLIRLNNQRRRILSNWPWKLGGILKYFPDKIKSVFLQPLFIQIKAKKCLRN